ncbi:DUF6480 family protein [Mycobacterium sp. ACS4331]|uniref:DUF6480 family protein n=1 Tax=Mycobacterium sp. ACS4331 TaxID=1834121 RepID=UPI0008015161|nr:DUF6480 family protein [Mycobacterium sp. ACS4331]OBF28739.1 hypothetical protein A5727_24815 [Mycobacterium sp. ACS4331]
MTDQREPPSPDPDPAQTAGLGAGGDVQPGDTPPDSDQLSATSNPDPPVRHRASPTSVVALVAAAVFILLFVAAAVLLIARMAGALG